LRQLVSHPSIIWSLLVVEGEVVMAVAVVLVDLEQALHSM
jgi:hypothetical protein